MKRTLIHAMFGGVAVACAVSAAYGWARLQQAERINAAVVAASTPHADPRNDRAADDARQVQLARAIALSKAGSYEQAARLYNGLVPDGGRLDEVGRAALFDLGNLYLREGSIDGSAQALKSLAMIGEAKARYRLVLRAAPDDWDARYNLERALWLAPETGAALERPDVKEQHGVKLRGAQSQDLP
ncbi:tetratricopeptide repeat protein [Paraburkholderia sp. MMS20-SJTR3]|uniref:Tetratricopeptide repeat protein n=1 Tax=Paraburkholderia sejongensis TaxID=2886946 RepID=A0ABS8K1U6_9BURK|nr:tetratricopeptide repeat protein [Paraburkholderia sp. MMS20-SJTR3]MCC8396119.1 tetratricopeptide repeat protein [Paraburkholderia sp. MMS20-SJTR3]